LHAVGEVVVYPCLLAGTPSKTRTAGTPRHFDSGVWKRPPNPARSGCRPFLQGGEVKVWLIGNGHVSGCPIVAVCASMEVAVRLARRDILKEYGPSSHTHLTNFRWEEIEYLSGGRQLVKATYEDDRVTTEHGPERRPTFRCIDPRELIVQLTDQSLDFIRN
jgi:hypothetical protein